MSSQQTAKIRLRNVSKVFGKKPQRALKLLREGISKEEILKRTRLAVGVVSASFDVYEGETLVVMGLSGSGKSTLIRCVNRLIEPTGGSIEIDGTDIVQLDPDDLRDMRRTKFGMVFQSFALFPHRTILGNVEFGLEIQGVPAAERLEKAQSSIRLVGLEGWESSIPMQLSGGMRQRVGLARALAVDPDILLMDEAFSALDPLIRTEMQDELLSLESQVQKTILFITHDLDEALKMGDRIVLMNDGKIVQIGPPEEILSEPADDYVERFIANVDITKVLTAEDIMQRELPITRAKDGPRTALRLMRDKGWSGVFVVTKKHELVGYLSAERAVEALQRADRWVSHLLRRDEYPVVSLDKPIREIFPLVADSHHPVAVTDADNRLRGYIVRGSVLAALSSEHNVEGASIEEIPMDPSEDLRDQAWEALDSLAEVYENDTVRKPEAGARL